MKKRVLRLLAVTLTTTLAVGITFNIGGVVAKADTLISKENPVYRNLKKPTVTIYEYAVENDGVYDVKFDGSQPDGTKVYYYLYENGKVVTSNRGYYPGSGVGDFPIAGQFDGVYEYQLLIEDEDGNQAISEIATVTVKQLKKPVVSIEEYGVNNDGLYSIYVNGKQEDGRKLYYDLYKDGEVVRSNRGYFAGSGTGEYHVGADNNGIYKYYAKIEDLDGNTAESDTLIVIVNKDGKLDWKTGKEYKLGDQVVYKGIAYKCTYAHISQESWNPGEVSALWEEIK